MISISRPAESALEVGLAEFCGHGLPDQSGVYTDASDGNSMPASGRRFGVNAGSLDQSHVARRDQAFQKVKVADVFRCPNKPTMFGDRLKLGERSGCTGFSGGATKNRDCPTSRAFQLDHFD